MYNIFVCFNLDVLNPGALLVGYVFMAVLEKIQELVYVNKTKTLTHFALGVKLHGG